MFDIKQAEKEAREELAEEQVAKAKKLLKEKLRQISQARAVVANLEREYNALLLEAGSDLEEASAD